MKTAIEMLEIVQFAGVHNRCPICAGWMVGPYGETDKAHTKDCELKAILDAAKRGGESGAAEGRTVVTATVKTPNLGA